MDKISDDIKEKLNDYAKTAMMNNFIDGGGRVEDYIRYNKVKEDLEKENKIEKQKDLENN